MDVQTSQWTGCYDDNWKGIITDQSFAHPAKFARGLITRIFQHMQKNGMLRAGDLVVDPFGGIGTGGIVAASTGLRWFGCELEQKFVKMAQDNFALHRIVWEMMDDPLPVLVQGDSRRLREVIGKADAIISSPPYANEISGKHGETESAAESLAKRRTPGGSLGQSQRHGGYGDSDGNLSNKQAGDVDAVISSPPFPDNGMGDDRRFGGLKDTTIVEASKSGGGGLTAYGDTEGQLSNEQGETFWSEAKKIVLECHAILKPGGWTAWVCKAFVRKDKISDFPNDWCKLLMACGFVVTERIHAMLVKEWKENTLFDGIVTKSKKKASFFRRLAEAKGSPKIDWEEVIFARKPS